MKQDAYGEIYLWNRGMDRLVRVLQRLEPAATCTKQEVKAYEVRLEEVRAGLNAEFAEAVVKRERADHLRLQRQRVEWGEARRVASAVRIIDVRKPCEC